MSWYNEIIYNGRSRSIVFMTFTHTTRVKPNRNSPESVRFPVLCHFLLYCIFVLFHVLLFGFVVIIIMAKGKKNLNGTYITICTLAHKCTQNNHVYK